MTLSDTELLSQYRLSLFGALGHFCCNINTNNTNTYTYTQNTHILQHCFKQNLINTQHWFFLLKFDSYPISRKKYITLSGAETNKYWHTTKATDFILKRYDCLFILLKLLQNFSYNIVKTFFVSAIYFSSIEIIMGYSYFILVINLMNYYKNNLEKYPSSSLYKEILRQNI